MLFSKNRAVIKCRFVECVEMIRMREKLKNVSQTRDYPQKDYRFGSPVVSP